MPQFPHPESWYNLQIAGREVPAIQISADVEGKVELPSGKVIPATFANFISLRETNPDGPNAGVQYLTVTRENKRFTTMRFDAVVGLDVDAEGVRISLQTLEQRRGEDIRQRQAAQQAARGPIVADVDLALDEDLDVDPDLVPTT